MGRLKEDKNNFNMVCLYNFLLASTSLSGDKNVSFFLVQEGNLSHEFYLLFSETNGEVRVPFLHLLFFKCLQLKITLMLNVTYFRVAYSTTLHEHFCLCFLLSFRDLHKTIPLLPASRPSFCRTQVLILVYYKCLHMSRHD